MTPQVALLITVLLAGIPASGARGGKAAKGLGGAQGGLNNLSTAKAREITWEDIVIASQLSAMCFGALFALCIVACCAYKICGPAEEIDWDNRYSVFKSPERLPAEILREIYTLSASNTLSVDKTSTNIDTTAESPTNLEPAPNVQNINSSTLLSGVGPRETSVNKEPVLNSINRSSSGSLLSQLPNGRPRLGQGGPLVGDIITPVTPRRSVPVSNSTVTVTKPQRLLNLGCMLDGRPRLFTLATVSSAKAARVTTSGRGAANRLAEYNQHSSTLDLAKAAAASSPCMFHRSLSDPNTNVV